MFCVTLLFCFFFFSSIRRHTRCALVTGVQTCALPISGMMQPLLEARGLNKRFGAVTASRDIEVAVTAQEVVGIIGANGAGKTTFVNMVTGWLKPSSGRVLFEGRDITGRTPREITRLGICSSFQVPHDRKSTRLNSSH